MKRIVNQPIKVIDNFFESPTLWRHYALKQNFTRDETSTWPGLRSPVLNEINPNLFHILASKIITHLHNVKNFSHLKVNFAVVDESYNLGWLHQDETNYNVAGVIFLNTDPPKETGIGFYKKIMSTQTDFNKLFFEEIKSDPDTRSKFTKYKEDQRLHFKKNMSVENIFNRCVIFPPNYWHAAEKYFGNDMQSFRLTINFFGTAI